MNSEAPNKIDFAPLDDANIHSQSDINSLLIIVSLKQNLQPIRKTYFDLAKKINEGCLCVGYLKGNTFSITQPYLPDIGNPCFFCTIDRIQHYEKQAHSTNPWSRMLLFCSEHKIDLPSPPITALQRALILGLISDRINLYTGHKIQQCFQDNALTSTSINLSSGEITEDIYPHWPMCECMRISHAKHPA
ncbi:hypothetical protein D3C76_672790 [compost metagenome]